MAQKVEDDPFGFEQRHGRADQTGHHRAVGNPVAVGGVQGDDAGRGVAHAFDDQPGDGQSGHQGVFLGHDAGGQPVGRGEHGHGGAVRAVLLQGEINGPQEKGQGLPLEKPVETWIGHGSPHPLVGAGGRRNGRLAGGRVGEGAGRAVTPSRRSGKRRAFWDAPPRKK